MSEIVGLDGANVDAAAPDAATAQARDWPFEFRGVSGEYFRIWIVNLALSIVTLGVFSAWAKVRRERYFYGNTWVAGAPFEYLADPLNILKGRVVAVSVFALYVVLQQTMPLAQVALLALVLIATPWIITSALRFRARYSAWNTATFRFAGTVRSALRCYLLLGALLLPTVGLIYPYMRGEQRRFMIDGHRFGGYAFEFGGTSRAFYAIFGMAVVIGTAFLVIVAGGAFMLVRFVYPLAPAASAGVAHGLATAVRYGSAGVVYFAMFLGYVYIASRVTNLSYNATRLGAHRFRSTLRMRDLVAIYLTNAVAIVASVGLLVPWAQIRLARYRANHLTLCADGDVFDLVLESGGDRAAFGAETANVFDLDISL